MTTSQPVFRGVVALAAAAAALTAACSDAAVGAAPTRATAAGTTAPAVAPSTSKAAPVPSVTAGSTTPAIPTSTPFAAATSTTRPEPAAATATTMSPFARPDWLGTRVLPRRPDDHGEVQPTPPELTDRRFETIDLLPPPVRDAYEWTIGPVPPDVAARSSWSTDCPVALEDLAYLTVAHYGFDGAFHTGELIVNAAVAADVVEVFRSLHAARFPIEQMRVVRADEIDAPPTGDSNDTTAFVCRPAVGTTSWSQHAYGLAIDINPFHNPYHKGDLVLPELASAYLDRSELRAGMIGEGDAVTAAFAAIGWGWGGRWTSLRDWMHFSRSGN